MPNWFEVLSDLERTVTLYARAIRAFGGYEEAAFVSQVRFWMKRCDDTGGWVFKTPEELEEELCLGPRQQEYIREKLVKLGVLETQYRRTEHLLYYRLKADVFNRLMDSVKGNPKNGNARTKHPEPAGVVSRTSGSGIPTERDSVIIKESTSNSTSESTIDPLADLADLESDSESEPKTFSSEEAETFYRKKFRAKFRNCTGGKAARNDKTAIRSFVALCEKIGPGYEGVIMDALKQAVEGRGGKSKINDFFLKDFLDYECQEIIESNQIKEEVAVNPATKPPAFLDAPREEVTEAEKQDWEATKKKLGIE
jgi:hypothetical protein